MRVLFAFLLAIVCVCATTTWNYCGQGSLTVNGFSVTPDPPHTGQSVTVYASATLSKTVTAGAIWANVSFYDSGWHAFPGSPFKLNICSDLQPTINCPIDAGTYTQNITTTVPGIIPPGTFSGTLFATDQNNALIVCINWQTVIGS